MEEIFIQSWKAMTKLIYEYEGSYGSRLHRSDDELFIAYALWPDKQTFDNAGRKLPTEADVVRIQMRESCIEIKTEYRLEVLEDMLMNK